MHLLCDLLLIQLTPETQQPSVQSRFCPSHAVNIRTIRKIHSYSSTCKMLFSYFFTLPTHFRTLSLLMISPLVLIWFPFSSLCWKNLLELALPYFRPYGLASHLHPRGPQGHRTHMLPTVYPLGGQITAVFLIKKGGWKPAVSFT